MQPILHQTPKIKKALPRAIEHELRRPGELADYLTYRHLMQPWVEIEREEYLARRAKLKQPKPAIVRRTIK